jgi:hypothetical protein
MEKVSDVLDFLPYILKMPSNRIWIDYDDEADVLYTSVLSLTDLYIIFFIFFRHSRGNGNPVVLVLDSCFRRNDR